MAKATFVDDAVGHTLKTTATVTGYQYMPTVDRTDGGGSTKIFPAGGNVGIMQGAYSEDGNIYIETALNYQSYFFVFGEYLFTLYDGSWLTQYGTSSGITPGADPSDGGSGGGTDDGGGGGGGGTGGGTDTGGGNGNGGTGGGSGTGSGGLLGLGGFNLFGLNIPWAMIILGVVAYEVIKSNNNGKR